MRSPNLEVEERLKSTAWFVLPYCYVPCWSCYFLLLGLGDRVVVVCKQSPLLFLTSVLKLTSLYNHIEPHAFFKEHTYFISGWCQGNSAGMGAGVGGMGRKQGHWSVLRTGRVDQVAATFAGSYPPIFQLTHPLSPSLLKLTPIKLVVAGGSLRKPIGDQAAYLFV